jgi:hypothetical protein
MRSGWTLCHVSTSLFFLAPPCRALMPRVTRPHTSLNNPCHSFSQAGRRPAACTEKISKYVSLHVAVSLRLCPHTTSACLPSCSCSKHNMVCASIYPASSSHHSISIVAFISLGRRGVGLVYCVSVGNLRGCNALGGGRRVALGRYRVS